MPYIDWERRHQIAVTIPDGLTAGDMNFLLSDALDQWIGLVPDYDRLNSAIGILECCKAEIQRRLIIPYEILKQKKNGDVFMEREYWNE